MHIVILSASVRQGRSSHRVARFFNQFIPAHYQQASVELVDLKDYDFPLFEERLKFMDNPSGNILSFAQKIKQANGVIIVTPEYNGGYPASLKNVTDLLYDEWRRKPIALVTVSAGPFGGTQVMTSLLFTLWKIGAWVVPAMYPVPRVDEAYNENGDPVDKEATEKKAKRFLNELTWCMEAAAKMKQ
ncbi:NADPH-dependent FMN reductase [Deminuibacter soli]|uniref:NADPH-dependent oxidoreductase n=1 Tax=Deminuibacter soli TaxID=2291815 RepID=A0A3E1NI99_9BACT|nr:NAD(P)H-dependent oxidoreductase [Deminuibacter soli]RFM27649.1 NADPH-dependent oxidoreductase [Deminuibacter soli]